MELDTKTERSLPDIAKGCSGNEDSLTFQSKDPIISIPMQDRKEKTGAEGESPVNEAIHRTSYLETLMHLLRGNIGSGVFAMGDAVKNAGIFLGPCIILFLGIVCVHCQHILLSASKKVEKLTESPRPPDFADTVELCFETGPNTMKKMAPYMKKLVNLFLCITQLGFCCVYFVFIATNMKQVLDYYGYEINVHLHMAMVFLPILLSCLLRNLKFLAPISTIANAFMVVGIVISLYFSTKDLPKTTSRKYVAQWNQLPLFFGTALYAFEGIGLVLPLRNEMKNSELFTRPLGVLNFGMTIATLIFITMGFISYLQYGEAIKGSVTLNLPEHDILAQSVKVIISLAILLSYALQFYIPVEIMWPRVVDVLGPFKHPIWMEYVFRTLLVLLTFILAEAIPYLNLFISLVGAVSSTALALLFPPIIELAITWSISKMSPWILMKNAVIILLGLLGCITGTYESLRAIVKTFMGER